MARIKASKNKYTLKIDKFLGVNECPDGDTNIRVGEASTMTNFKITSDYNLQKRHGTQNIANLLFNYDIDVGDEVTLQTEIDQPTTTYMLYPNMNISDGGILYLLGTPVEATALNASSYVDYYWKSPADVIYKLKECENVQYAEAVHAVQGWYTLDGISYAFFAWKGYPQKGYTALSITSGVVSGHGSYVTTQGAGLIGKFVQSPTTGTFFLIESSTEVYRADLEAYVYVYNGRRVSFYANEKYNWNFYPISVIPNTTDSQVRGIWSGRVGETEYICAACNNRLWALSESDGVWTKLNLGTINTENKVHLFGFDSKLYILNGTEYKYWDASTYKTYTYIASGEESGSYYITVDSVNYKFSLTDIDEGDKLIFSTNNKKLTLNGVEVEYTTGDVTDETNLTVVEGDEYYPPSNVTGYRPLTHVGRSYDGSTAGTLLERVNMLNGQRRVWFSPPGGEATFTLPEKNLASVDYAKTIATGEEITIQSSDLTNGTVTLASSPSEGTNTIEIGYTVSSTFRDKITSMTRTELFGINDGTIMFYGDGTNKVYYSEIDYDGIHRADYIPDFNQINIGESNNAVTDLIRHHDRLLAFKDNSAYSIRFDTLDLEYGDNTLTTSAFHVSTVNRDVGSAGYGQAQLIDNRVRTLDGRSIYEWTATDSSGNVTADQRNAKVISDKVQNTLRELDFTKAITFWDTINREYYIVENGIAIINNLQNGTWYIYRNFPAICMILYKDELYFGTEDGFIRHVSRDYLHDVGAIIQCYWEGGATDYGSSNERKYSDYIWTVLKPENNASINLTVVTDRISNYDEEVIEAASRNIETGIFSYLNLNYEHFTYNINLNPQTQRRKIKAKNFVWQKIIYSTATNDTTATVLKTEIKVRKTGVAK